MNFFGYQTFSRRKLCMLNLQKFIPGKWKHTIHELDESSQTITSLVLSLKDSATQGNVHEAFKTFSLVQVHKSSSICNILDPVSSLVISCTDFQLLHEGKQLHAHIIRLGLEHCFKLVPKIVSFYSALNLLDDAHVITDKSNILHPLPWNLLISSYVRNGLYWKALTTYSQMVSKGSRPDNFTFPSVLKACGQELDLGFGMDVHRCIRTSGHDWCMFVQNALVSMYVKCGEIGVARELFDKMLERDAISWNSIISGYASKGMWQEACSLFESMRVQGVNVNIITWNTIAGGCLRGGNYMGALAVISQMRHCGVRLDHVATIIALGGCSHIRVIKLGKEIHASSIRSHYDGLDNVRNVLITMYSRCDNLVHAETLFQLTEDKTLVTWNSILSGYSHLNRSEEVARLFREMQLAGVKPNFVTIASILPLCARVAHLQHGKELHCYILRHEEFKEHLLLWNALLDMYARSGRLLEAKEVFDSLAEKDEKTYTSLISGYGIHGEAEAALKLFDEMIKFHVKPDHVAMVAVLSACSHSGLVTQGEMLFEKMQKVYELIPSLEHYACMVDLYGRAGLLNKAREIITWMPHRATPAMWATLLGACLNHGNTKIGEWTAEILLELKPEKSGYYKLIANMYAAAGAWSKLADVRTIMRDLGVQKDPGFSWVDVGMGFSRFSVGDTSNPHAHEFYPMLEALTALMKDAGYVTDEEFASYYEDEGYNEHKALCVATTVRAVPVNTKNQLSLAVAPSPAPARQDGSSISPLASNNSQDEVEGHSICVRNLPYSVSVNVSDLEAAFQNFGPIKKGGIQVRNHKHTGHCFGFVEFLSANSMENAIHLKYFDLSRNKHADPAILNLLKTAFWSNSSMACPYVTASDEEKMENYLMSGFSETCGDKIGVSNVAFMESCSLDGTQYTKLTDLNSVHDYLNSRVDKRSNGQADLVVVCHGDPNSLELVDSPHSEGEILSELIDSIERSGAKYAAVYVSDPFRSIQYRSSRELERFLVESSFGNENAKPVFCDEICRTKSTLLEGLFVGIVLLIILISGLCCMMGIDSPTRFETPQE